MSFRMVLPLVPRGLPVLLQVHMHKVIEPYVYMCTTIPSIYRRGYGYSLMCTYAHSYRPSHMFTHLHVHTQCLYPLHMHNHIVTPLCAYTKHRSHTYACTQADTFLIDSYTPADACGMHYTTQSIHTCTSACAHSFSEAKASVPVIEKCPEEIILPAHFPQRREACWWPRPSVPRAQALSGHSSHA